MKNSAFRMAIAGGVAAALVLGASTANAESAVGQSVLGPDIPAMAMTAAEMEAVEGKRWRWRVRINLAQNSGNSTVGPNPTNIVNQPLGGGTYSVNAFSTSSTSSISISTSCSGTCNVSANGTAVALSVSP